MEHVHFQGLLNFLEAIYNTGAWRRGVAVVSDLR